MLVLAGAADCVRTQILDPSVMFAVRAVVLGLAAHFTVTAVVPVPEAGVTTAHVWSLARVHPADEASVTTMDAVEFAA